MKNEIIVNRREGKTSKPVQIRFFVDYYVNMICLANLASHDFEPETDIREMKEYYQQFEQTAEHYLPEIALLYRMYSNAQPKMFDRDQFQVTRFDVDINIDEPELSQIVIDLKIYEEEEDDLEVVEVPLTFDI